MADAEPPRVQSARGLDAVLSASSMAASRPASIVTPYMRSIAAAAPGSRRRTIT